MNNQVTHVCRNCCRHELRLLLLCTGRVLIIDTLLHLISQTLQLICRLSRTDYIIHSHISIDPHGSKFEHTGFTIAVRRTIQAVGTVN